MNAVLKELLSLDELGFGKYFCPEMVVAKFIDGKWQPWSLVQAEEFSIHPAAKVFHYSQEVFEGMKVYKHPDCLALFRPTANIQRMSRSCEALAMPAYPEEEYLKSLVELVKASQRFVPEEPGSLYLRPTMIGTSPFLGVAAASEYVFFILASPVGGYFGSVVADKPAGIRVRVSTKHVRAAPGGVGFAKTGGNYAASLKVLTDTRASGFNDVMFLDAVERKYIEELSGMNVMVVSGNKISTPPLGDTILPGITRDTLLKIAKADGMEIAEEKIDIHQVLEDIESGKNIEVLACGTAAVVTAIESITYKEKEYKVYSGDPGPITTKLYSRLNDFQRGRSEPIESDWIHKISL